MRSFTADPDLDVNGFSYGAELGGHTLEGLCAEFPEAVAEGYYAPEDGYDDERELRFRGATPMSSFYLYARYGVVRIGCLEGWDNPNLPKFKAFLLGRLN